MLKSIMGKVVDQRIENRRARVLPPAGWRGTKAPPRFTGYHKQLDRSDMAVLVKRLQRDVR
jgi:hypothetical protein